MRLIAQLIKDNYLILRVLQELLKHFNCTAIWTSFVLPAVTVAAIFILDLSDSQFNIAASCSSSLQCCPKYPMLSNNYHYTVTERCPISKYYSFISFA